MKTYGTITLSKDRKSWHLECSAHVRLRLKRLFPGLSRRTAKKLTVSNNRETCRDLAWVLSRWPLEFKKAEEQALLERVAEEHAQETDLLEQLLDGRREPRRFDLALPAREYQRVAADAWLTSRGLLLADEVGLGKTACAIAALTDPATRPALVVTLAHLPRQWQAEIKKFAPSLQTHIIKNGTPYDIRIKKAHADMPLLPGVASIPDVLITTYHKLAGWEEALGGMVKSIIFDEAQELRGGPGKKDKPIKKNVAAAAIAEQADYRIGLSVGPRSFVELRGGPFGSGWVGAIEDAWERAGGTAIRDATGYEIKRCPAGVEGRGWTGERFGWKAVRNVIRHDCDRPARRLKLGAMSLIATDDHSVFVASDDGILERRSCELSKGDIVPVDDGAGWEEGSAEQCLDVAELARHTYRAQVTVPLDGFTRKDFGLTAWQWQNCHREATYGTRLPVGVYLKHREKLPSPTHVYVGCGKAAAVSATLRLSEWAYVIGFYLGDGWVSSGTRVAFAVENARVGDFVSRLHQLGIGLRPKVRKMPGASCEVRCTHKLFATILDHLFSGSRCHEKRIPPQWVSWPREARVKLLHGLVDSDGHVARNGNKAMASFVTTSGGLARDVEAVLRSVGVRAGTTERKPARGGLIGDRRIIGMRVCHHVHWSLAQMEGRTSGKFGHQSRFHGEFNEACFTSATPVQPDGYVYDFEMDGHPSFVANGLLVHNTATPIHNYGGEFFNVLNVLRPHELGTKSEFAAQWCDHGTDAKVKIKEPQAFGSYLREQGFMLRRTREDVGRELPALVKVPHYIAADQKPLNDVQSSANELARIILEKGDRARGAVMQASEELSNMVRQATGIAKAPHVADFVRMLVESGEPVVLYGWHRTCFAPGTMVLMADGTTKAVEDVSVGDLVMGPDSKGRRVLNLARGCDEMYRVTPNKGDPWICSSHHTLVLKRTEGDRYAADAEMTAAEFFALSPRLKRSYALFRTAVEFEAASSVVEPWFVGYWLGDGAANLKTLRVASADQEVARECASVASRHGLKVTEHALKNGTTPCKFYDLVLPKMGVGTNPLKKHLRGLNLHNNKHIPHSYKTSSIADRRELLAGIIDSDGHVHHGNAAGTAEVAAKDHSFAADVAFVARSLGLAAYVRQVTRPSGYGRVGGRYHKISISGDLTQLPMRITRKRAPERHQRKDVLRTGFSVEPIGTGSFYGFETDGDHLFLLDDFTVVHNCYDIWLERLRDLNPVMYTGSESASKKAASRDAFVNGEANILIMSLRSGAGLDGLQHRGRTVVFGELDWSPAVHHQAAGRVHRDGQQNSVVAYYLISDSGSDPIVADVLGVKKAQIEGVINPDGALVEMLETGSDRIRRLAEHYLGRHAA